MKIAICIPTFNRIEKLERCLKALEKQTYSNFETYIYCDNNDIKTRDWLIDIYDRGQLNFIYIVNDKQEFAPGSWNKFFKEYALNYNASMWLVDDTEVYPNFLEEMVRKMEQAFPDTDGVIGSMQECPGRSDYTFKTFGQPLIGRKFIERYKEVYYQVCCLDYRFLYQDEELYEFANSIDKYDVAQKAILKHYHPAFKPEEMDSTHPLSRGKNAIADKITYQKRKKLDLIWGKTWKLLNQEEM